MNTRRDENTHRDDGVNSVDAQPIIVDAGGRRCPVPVIMAARAAAGAAPGTVLVVRATDPATAVDLPAWCRMRGHRVLSLSGPDGDDSLVEVRVQVGDRVSPSIEAEGDHPR